MGILDRLGLKGEDWSEFSAWFEAQLYRILHARAMDAATEQSDALLVELDQRVQRFVARRGEGELVRALEAWIHRTPNLVAIVQAGPFRDPKKVEERLAHLERQHGAGPGLRQLDHALYCMGVLVERLAPPVQEQDARTAVPAMLEVLWPTTSEERSLRVELAGLIEADLARATWELCSLRTWTFSLRLAVRFTDDRAAGDRLGERMDQLLAERVDGEPVPPNITEFLAHRRREYFKVVEEGGPRSEFMLTPIVAGTFAWYCRTLTLQVRLIGAREFTVADYRLDAMIKAYRGRAAD